MTEHPEVANRRQRIDADRADAARLLQAAKHETMHEQIRLAERDLNEGVAWLERIKPGTQMALLGIVDLTIMLAEHRLNMVDTAVKKYGPDVMLFG